MEIADLPVTPYKIYSLSEQAVTIEFGNIIAEDLLQQVNTYNELIHQNPFPGFHTTVPAFATLTLFFNVIQVMQADDMAGADSFEKITEYIHSLKKQTTTIADNKRATITIPVCYGGDFGPDIEEVAAINNLSLDEVIQLHSNAIYKVYMIGFVPGFAYLGGMSTQLSTPRKPTPRQAVSIGSVGIAGNQTGIYPLETPGGWQLIGRTPLAMFNPSATQPSLLKAGDTVTFKAIDEYEFEKLAHAN